MDDLTSIQRRKTMQAIKSKNTKIEVLLAKSLWHRGIRYRKNVKSILGSPDIAIKKYKIAIFCDGDFWHGKNYNDKEFTTNKTYWDNKIKHNRERDLEVTIKLRDLGWTVIRFWESDIKKNLKECTDSVIRKIYNQKLT